MEALGIEFVKTEGYLETTLKITKRLF